jgi:imidazolonepropionase-like amidohydrolase
MKATRKQRLFRILFQLLAYRPPVIAVPKQGTRLNGVTVVNPGAGRQAGQTLIVEGDRIARVASFSHGAETGDGRYAGSYVLPGLIDMHVHIPPQARALVNLLFLAHGVTTVREVGDADGTTWAGRARILQGEAPGPRIFTCGPVLDGAPPFLPTSRVIRSSNEARAVVAALAARGADFIKVHHQLSPAILAAIRQAASGAGLRVVGHVPPSVAFEDAGIWDVQHLDGLVTYPQPPETTLDYRRRWQALNVAQIERYVRISVAQGLVHTPTLVTYEALAQMDSDPQRTTAPRHLMPRHYRKGIWDRDTVPFLRSLSDEVLALMRQAMTKALTIVRHLHEAGVRLHLGTDTAAVPFVVPGASLHREMRLMVRAGIALAAVWQAGTRAAGASLETDGLGAVVVGAPADLLIFAEDPTRDLDALATLRAVIAQGRLYPKADLDDALDRHRERFEHPVYDAFSTALLRFGARLMS